VEPRGPIIDAGRTPGYAVGSVCSVFANGHQKESDRMKNGRSVFNMFNRFVAPRDARGTDSGRKFPGRFPAKFPEKRSEDAVVVVCPVCGQKCSGKDELSGHLKIRGDPGIQLGDQVRCRRRQQLVGRVVEMATDHQHMIVAWRMTTGEPQARTFLVWMKDKDGRRFCIWDKVKRERRSASALDLAVAV
jgi:hypothetical protein